MPIENLTIIGCGGHSKVVLDAILATKRGYTISLKDSNPNLLGKKILGYAVEKYNNGEELNGFFHIAIGSNFIRAQLYETHTKENALTIIHPAAVISPYALIGKGVFIAANAILAPSCDVGDGSIVNHGAIVDHDVKLGGFVHIAPNATLGGNVSVGKGVLIGAGATVLPGISIGDGAIVGAGAVVSKDIPANSTVKGVPAK